MKTIKSTALLSLLVIGGCLHNGEPMDTGKAPIPKADLAKVDGKGEARVDHMIARSKGWIETMPDHPKGYNALGLALMQKGRETGELDRYVEAMTAFEEAVKLDPKNSESLRYNAWCSTMFHNFPKALELANKALEIEPKDAFSNGVLADSYIELGQYEKATEAAQRMMDIRPDLASYSRAAQIRWIYGDVKGAILFMEKAMNAGGAFAENTAWCQTQLGDMQWKSGATMAAVQNYRDVLSRMPDYRHAQFGLARFLASEGKSDEAIALMKKSVRGTAPISYVLMFADYLKSIGKTSEAETEFARVPKLIQEHLEHGIEGDELVEASYYMKRGENLDKALELCESEVKEHTSIATYSTLAWAYFHKGRFADAEKTIAKARATGVQDAEVWYREGKIKEALGKKDEARRLIGAAFNLNPNFDLTIRQDASR